jgi:hypothetical protein
MDELQITVGIIWVVAFASMYAARKKYLKSKR